MWVHNRISWGQNIKNFGYMENWESKNQHNQRYPIEKSSDVGLSHEIIPSLRIHIKKIKKNPAHVVLFEVLSVFSQKTVKYKFINSYLSKS